MTDTYIVWPIALVLAFVLGFVADKTTLCSVGAVKQVLFQKKVSLLLSFASMVLWALSISELLKLCFPTLAPSQHRFDVGVLSLIGGIVFGVGAVLNDGCSLHTLTRLGRGNFDMLASIIGLLIGALLYRALLPLAPEIGPPSAASAIVIDPPYHKLLWVTLSAWVAFQIVRLVVDLSASRRLYGQWAREHSLRPASALLGIGNGILFAVVGTWMYTTTLIQGSSNLIFPDSDYYRPVPAILWWMLLAYLAGVAGSTSFRRGLVISIRPRIRWFRYLIAGTLMGIGASLIPGGNDVLLLNSMPSLSMHALPSYLAMLAGVTIALLGQRWQFTVAPRV